MTAEMKLEWILRHRDEPEMKLFIDYESRKLDRETVEETLTHIWAGFYDAEPVKEVFAEQVCKQCYADKRSRKIDDNRRHYAKVCAKRGAMING